MIAAVCRWNGTIETDAGLEVAGPIYIIWVSGGLSVPPPTTTY